jgi:lipopolysaccharide export system protein LptA
MKLVSIKNIRFFAAITCLVTALSLGAQAEVNVSTTPASGPSKIGDKYDTKLPVEISADNLEVLQHENKAIFKGNVIAVQGQIRLTGDTMIVHYRQKTDQPAGAQPAKPAPTPAPANPAAANSSPVAAQGAMGAITLIEMEGHVFAATPEESAKGDKGDYQVDEKLLHLTGDNVTLTRDKNILRGTALVYNLETGRSVLTNNGAKVGGTNGGRVRGVFVPNEEDKNKDKNKTKSKSSAAPTPVPAAPPSTTTTAP